jgi:hypothetical protein
VSDVVGIVKTSALTRNQRDRAFVGGTIATTNRFFIDEYPALAERIIAGNDRDLGRDKEDLDGLAGKGRIYVLQKSSIRKPQGGLG